MKVTLTSPLDRSALKAAFPRATRGMEDGEIDVLLQVEERALRAAFGVTATTDEVNEALNHAMIAAWPSFLQQVRNIAQENVGDSYQATFARAGVLDFEWPKVVSAILSGFAAEETSPGGPPATQLVR